MSKRLLVSFAHPDDESFGVGPLIAKYAAEGVEITLICATNGDAGSVDPDRLNGYDSVASLRLDELKCASQVLGFKEVITFGYRDSGMMGSADNQHPASLWQAPMDKLSAQIADVIRRIHPQVVVTFDPYGGYGHPDHIKIHQATVAAYHAVQSDPVHPQKLYYTAFPRGLLRVGATLMRLTGQDPRRAGKNHDLDFQAVLDATLPVHAKVYTEPYYDVGQRAAACHASQINPRLLFPLGHWLSRKIAAYSTFTRAEPTPNGHLEHDLFEGVTTD
jgi:LmbE family N-acetylglucosaminyl deacetylase